MNLCAAPASDRVLTSITGYANTPEYPHGTGRHSGPRQAYGCCARVNIDAVLQGTDNSTRPPIAPTPVGPQQWEHRETEREIAKTNTRTQLIYASQLLGILIQCLAKLSIVLLIGRISMHLSSNGLSMHITLAILAWTIFAFFTIAFQCGSSSPWDFSHTRCAAGGNLYYPVIALNMALDAALAVFFIPDIMRLQMERSLQYIVASLFAARIM